ncbi:hypothetical protein BKA70DRAFT_1560753 [Coprinopsis sp. MPI-PUGE-AT-0042]|nr:hypothetical protein BKA70DRAFT_1560753 [Coprinopsis sp. MPI-PUGE-AT-0042]
MARIDGIDLFAVTLRDRGQHDELCTLSENKIVQKEQAILELKNQTPACYHSLNSRVWDNNGFLHLYTIMSQMQLLEVDDAEGPAQSHIWNSRSNAGLPSQIGLRHRRHRLRVAYSPSRLIVKGFEGNLSSRNPTMLILFYDGVTNGALPSYVPLPEFGFVHEYSRRLIPSAQCYYGVLPEEPSQSNLHPQTIHPSFTYPLLQETRSVQRHSTESCPPDTPYLSTPESTRSSISNNPSFRHPIGVLEAEHPSIQYSRAAELDPLRR